MEAPPIHCLSLTDEILVGATTATVLVNNKPPGI